MNSPFLELENISKTFPGVKALNKVKFDIYPGEVHSLVGENGAGKSTLIKVMSGAHQPDEGGIIKINGEQEFQLSIRISVYLVTLLLLKIL